MTAPDFPYTRDGYIDQMLDGITALQSAHPFAAVTLACCSIDLLSHVLYDPPTNDTGSAFEKTVNSKLPGYRDFGDPILQLRNGMVHEFQTGSNGIAVHISGELGVSAPPKRDGDDILISVAHFLAAVRTMFNDFFENADDLQKRRFCDRALIHVARLPPRLISGPVSMGLGQNYSTWVVGASSTAGPLPIDTFNPD